MITSALRGQALDHVEPMPPIQRRSPSIRLDLAVLITRRRGGDAAADVQILSKGLRVDLGDGDLWQHRIVAKSSSPCSGGLACRRSRSATCRQHDALALGRADRVHRLVLRDSRTAFAAFRV